MNKLIYDGSLEGLFSAIFEAYALHTTEAELIAEERYQPVFLDEVHTVVTSHDRADRVVNRLATHLGSAGVRQLMMVFLSELPERERLIFQAVRLSIAHPERNILHHLAHPDMLAIAKIVKSVQRESHRMKAFVRFERLKDDTYYAHIAPDFDVLPLIQSFFERRYQDQKWLIFDERRHYGIAYDLHEVQFFYPVAEDLQSLLQPDALHHERERAYQNLWRSYFSQTNIAERRNERLHKQNVPVRYWRYLTEKQLPR